MEWDGVVMGWGRVRMGWGGVGWGEVGWDGNNGMGWGGMGMGFPPWGLCAPIPITTMGLSCPSQPHGPLPCHPKAPMGFLAHPFPKPTRGSPALRSPFLPSPPHPKTPSTGSPNLNCGVAPHAIPTPTGGSWPHPFPTPHGATRGGSHPPCPIPPPQLMGWGPKSPPVGLAAAFIPATKGGEEEEEAVGGGGRWGWLPRGAGGTHAAR